MLFRSIFDGGVKEGVEEYKKLITKMKDANGNNGKNKIDKKVIESLSEKSEWKKHFTINPDLVAYGNNEAAIFDYGIFDEDNQPLPIVDNSEYVDIKMKVQFNQDIEDPFVSVTIKDFHGKELCGNNMTLIIRPTTRLTSLLPVHLRSQSLFPKTQSSTE